MATSPHRHIQRAGREALAVVRGETNTHTYLRNRLLAILWVTVALGIASTLVVFFDVYAITVVATLAGSFGSFFVRRSHERDVASAAADSIAERSPQR